MIKGVPIWSSQHIEFFMFGRQKRKKKEKQTKGKTKLKNVIFE